MTRTPLFYLLVGAALFYGFLKVRGVIEGPPWAASPAGGRALRAA